MRRVISIVGPTASGKTALSVALAQKLGGEIVSVDSMQVYKGLDIGTAKVKPNEMGGIPHYMLDVLEPTESCSVKQFTALARKATDAVLSKGKYCILAGGTGLYVDHLIEDTCFVDLPQDAELSASLESCTTKQLYDKLQLVDAAAAAEILPQNRKRIKRALEIIMITGKSKLYWDALSHQNSNPLDAIKIGITYQNRETLYERINRRVDIMKEQGLEQEVRALLSIDGFAESTAAQAIGYKEFIAYIEESVSLDEALEQIKLASRRYAKRQLTWFRRDPAVNWIYADGKGKDEILCEALKIIERNS